MEPIELSLPVFSWETNSKAGNENLAVEQLGANHYRLVYSPGFVEGLAAGDEFELSSTEAQGYKILRRSGNLTVWIYFEQDHDLEELEIQNLREAVEKIGGWLDGGSLLIFTIPISTGFQTIANLFDGAKKDVPDISWLYGNVYDPKDGNTPLNWWKSEG
jgi:hypothetical protein